MVAKRDGEISVRRAATLLGCNEKTIRRWAHSVLGEGGPTRIEYARRDISRQIYLSESEIRTIAAELETERKP